MLRELTKMVKPTCSFTMLAECCHSGGLIEGAVEQVGISTLPFHRPPPETQAIINDRIQSDRGLGILFSACQSKEYAWSCARLGGSYFTNSIVKKLWKHSGNICNEPLAIEINDSLSGRQQIGLYCSPDQARHKFFEAPPPPPPPSPWTNQRLPLDVNAGLNQGGSDLTLKGRPFAASNSQVGRKQKQRLGSYSGLASSSGTANTAIPSSGSPSTPSMKTALATRQHNALGSLASKQNPLAVMDHLENDGSLGDNIGPFSSLADTNHKGRVGKGFSFKEIKHGMASSHKVDCCHFSSDGKLLVTGGHDKKASLWCTKTFYLISTLEEHTQWITDVRFCPNMLYAATSSADRTVKVWDVNNPSHSLRTFAGNAAAMSVDFHPIKHDIICSCDNKEIRYWSIENDSCVGVFKGGVTQVRFQPGLGKLLAAIVNNVILILDAETLNCKFKLQGHKSLFRSVCWHSSGNYLAAVCDDLVKIWSVGSDSSGVCNLQLNAAGTKNKFKTCIFHPIYHVLIIGCDESLTLWNFMEHKKMTVPAHGKLVSALAISDVTGLVASVSHDKSFKIWK